MATRTSIEYHYIFDFGSIATGTYNTRTFTITKQLKGHIGTVKTLRIDKDTSNSFFVQKVSENKNNLEILVVYTPTVPDHHDVTFRKIITDTEIIICLRGYSTGIRVAASTKYLIFYRTEAERKTETTFELKNFSNAPTYFQFDYDNSQNIFQIEPISGELLPNDYVFVHVRFIYQVPGQFFVNATCLILYSEPIHFEFFGINLEKDMCDDNLEIDNIYLPKITGHPYIPVFNNYYGDTELRTVYKLSTNYLNLNLENFQGDANFEFYITNLTKQCMKILWHFRKCNLLEVLPNEYCARPGEKVYFNCRCIGLRANQYYQKTLYGNIYTYKDINKLNDVSIRIPYPITVNLFGNTFLQKKQYLSEIEVIPKTVYMPVTTEDAVAYNTFIIKNIGSVPTQYEFCPPSLTNFEVRPMKGIIFNNIQIFAVKFNAKGCKTVSECWKLKCNDSEKDWKLVTFVGKIENMEVVIEDSNEINFGNLYPESEKLLKLSIENLCGLHISCVLSENSQIEFRSHTVELKPYEKSEILVSWRATLDSLLQDAIVNISALQSPHFYTAKENKVQLNVRGICSYIKLFAFPDYLNLGSILCGHEQYATFTIFNYGDCELNFVLKCEEIFGWYDEIAITLTPSSGKLLPRSFCRINISVLTNSPGITSYQIKYYIKVNDSSEKLIDNTDRENSKSIVQIDYFATCPVLKVTNITKNHGGPLFAKDIIWQFFEIEKLNEILLKIKPNETKNFVARAPCAEIDMGIKKEVVFEVTNISSVDSEIKMTRKKLCECTLKENGSSPYRRVYTYEHCLHRKLVQIYIRSYVQAYSTEYLTISMNYLLPGWETILFEIELSQKRRINFFINILGLLPKTISTLHASYKFNIYLQLTKKQKDSIQIFWLLNNSNQRSYYQLKTDVLDALNSFYNIHVLKCLNPEGCIPPKSVFPLKFIVAPVSKEDIQVHLPLVLENRENILEIRIKFHDPINTCILKEICKNHSANVKQWKYWADTPVRISNQYLLFNAMKSYSSKTKIIFLRNMSKTQRFAFWFEGYNLPGVFRVCFEPNTGILDTGSCVVLSVKCQWSDIHIFLNVRCICSLLDVSLLQSHIFSRQTAQSFAGVEEIEEFSPIAPAPKIYHEHVTVSFDFSLETGEINTLLYNKTAQISPAICPTFYVNTLFLLSKVGQTLPVAKSEDKNMCIKMHLRKRNDLDDVISCKELSQRSLSNENECQSTSENQCRCTIRTSEFISTALSSELISNTLSGLLRKKSIKNINPVSSLNHENNELTYEINFKNFPNQNISIIKDTISCALWDVLQSVELKVFLEKEHFCTMQHHYYHMKVDEPEKEFNMKLYLNKVPKHLVSYTLQTNISEVLNSSSQISTFDNSGIEAISGSTLYEHFLPISRLYPEKFAFIFDHMK